MNRAEVLLFLAVAVLVRVEGLSWPSSQISRTLGLLRPSGQTEVQDPPDLWFTQQLDHFNPTDNRTWKQRCFVRSDFFKEGGPVFLYTEAEDMKEGSWENYAKQYNALMFSVEHRFYGESKPTSDLSVENLRFLTTEQALADLAYFITEMTKHYQLPSDVKWIAFGGFYSGNLAAWMRLKYPHLVHGAMSASAPVLAQVDFQAYMGVVAKSLSTSVHGSACPAAVKAADSKFNQLLNTEAGRKQLKSMFNLCHDIDSKNQNDVNFLRLEIATVLASVVQYNNTRNGSHSINSMCDILTNKTIGDPLQRYAALKAMVNGGHCTFFKYQTFTEVMRKTGWRDPFSVGMRQWTYQFCTEFGHFVTSENETSLFGNDFPLEFYLDLCRDVYGLTREEVNRGVYRTNMLYGGLNSKATRVVYVNGNIDPWHALGITSTRVTESPAILIPGTAHCAIMYPPADTDVPALTAARKQVGQLIGQWLHEKQLI